jgi:hypothetical protein
LFCTKFILSKQWNIGTVFWATVSCWEDILPRLCKLWKTTLYCYSKMILTWMVPRYHIPCLLWFTQTILLWYGSGKPYPHWGMVWVHHTNLYGTRVPYSTSAMVNINHIIVVWFGQTILTLRNGMGTPYQIVWYPGTIFHVCYGSHRPYCCGMVWANHTHTEQWYGYTIPTCMVSGYHIQLLLWLTHTILTIWMVWEHYTDWNGTWVPYWMSAMVHTHHIVQV